MIIYRIGIVAAHRSIPQFTSTSYQISPFTSSSCKVLKGTSVFELRRGRIACISMERPPMTRQLEVVRGQWRSFCCDNGIADYEGALQSLTRRDLSRFLQYLHRERLTKQQTFIAYTQRLLRLTSRRPTSDIIRTAQATANRCFMGYW